MTDLREQYLSDIAGQLSKLRATAERAMAQVRDEDFARALDGENNSIAVIVKHISGNLQSRCTDFLTSDGEKPDRDRDAEFVLDPRETRAALMNAWSRAWDLLAKTVQSLRPEDVERTVYIRAEPHTVPQALHRHLSHLAYHVGQIVLLAKHWAGAEWQALTIPRGESRTFTQAKQAEFSNSSPESSGSRRG